MLQFLKDNYAYIMTVLFVISEGLAMIPGLKSNSIFQAIFNFLKIIFLNQCLD